MSGLFDGVFFALTMAWLLAEIAFTSFRRAGDDAPLRRDGGTLRWINLAIYLAIPLAFWASSQRFGRFPPDWQGVRWLGLALIVAGSAIKWSAVRQLKAHFTVDVAIVADHRLIRTGLYALVRHPSYFGALTAFLGLGVALGNLLSIPALMVPITLAFLLRIRVEEAVLSEAFPDEYPAYRRATRALIPYLL